MKIRDKQTGKVYAFDWKGSAPPSRDQFAQIKQQQDSGVNFDDVESGASTSPFSVSNPEPEIKVEEPGFSLFGDKVASGGLSDLITGKKPEDNSFSWAALKRGANATANAIDAGLEAFKAPFKYIGSKVAGAPIEDYGETAKSILGMGTGYQENETLLPAILPQSRILPKAVNENIVSLAANAVTDPTAPLVGGPGKLVNALGVASAGIHGADALSEGNLLGAGAYGGLAALGLHGMREPHLARGADFPVQPHVEPELKIDLPTEQLDVQAPVRQTLKTKLGDLDYTAEPLEGLSLDQGGSVKVQHQGKEVGNLNYSVRDDAVNVDWVGVDDSVRRQGIGAAMMDELQQRFPDKKVTGMWSNDGSALAHHMGVGKDLTTPVKEGGAVNIGGEYYPDYVKETLKAGKAAQKGTPSTPGINLVKQGEADVVNYFDEDGTLLASGQIRDGKISEPVAVTSRFNREELASMPQELKDKAKKAAAEVKAKLDEFVQGPKAIDELAVQDPDLDQLKQITQERSLPIDPEKLSPGHRANLLGDLGGTPQNPKQPPAPKIPKQKKPRSNFIVNFPDWVNRRHAAKLEGQLKGKEFADLDDLGPTAIAEIQAGNTQNPRYADVRKYFDEKFAEVKKAGSRLSYQQDYLPQIWENSKEEVAKVFGKRLTGKSSFEFSKSIKDYQEGIAKGLTPKFKTVGELVDFYERTANKGIADKGMFNMLKTIKSLGTKPKPGWVALNPQVFPIAGYRKNGALVNKVYYAPKDVADILHNYLREPEGALRNVAEFAGKAKNWVLSSGIPGTGLNMQGIKTLVGSTLTSKNPIKGAIRTAADLVNPKRAAARLQKNMKDAPRYMRAGMKFSAEDFGLTDKIAKSLPERLKSVAQSEGGKLKKLGKAVHEVHAHLFEDPMYQSILPATKLDHAKMIEADLLGKGVDPEEALSTAAHAVNEIFGGMNLDELGRSKQLQDIMRSTLLAPDHYESQARLGGKMLRSLKGSKQDLIYRRMTRNLIGAYVAASVSNKITSGHWMHENPEGKQFSVQAGKTTNGKERYIRPFGTMIDFARVPYDIAESLVKGDSGKTLSTIANRASVPALAGMHLLSNKDWRGRELYGPKVDLPDELANIGTEVGNVFLPTYGQAAGDYLTGKSGEEEALAAALEMPVHYGQKKRRYLAP